MKRPNSAAVLVLSLALSLAAAACSEDAEGLGNNDPGGMGAGRPETGAETPADSILTVADQPGTQDSTEAGSGTLQGAIRDSAQSMSQPQRPSMSPDSVNQAGERRRRP